MSAGAALVVLVQVTAGAESTVPPNLSEVTQCLSAAISAEIGTERCGPTIRRPCGSRSALAPQAACLDRLAEGYAAYASAVIEARAPTLARETSKALSARLAEGLSRSERQCAQVSSADAVDAAWARADCHLHRAAVLAHLVEFHPKRLVADLAAEA